MEGLVISSDIIIVGAGCCGLTTATALASKGFSITVLERRLDPHACAGQAALRRIEALMASINKSLDAKEIPEGAMNEASRLRQTVWGSFHRNLVLDGHNVQYLDALGAAVERLPPCGEFAMKGTNHLPSFSLTMDERKLTPEKGALNTGRLLLQRDWAAQPSLCDLEKLMFDAATANDRVDILFNTEVEHAISTEDGVVVTLSNGYEYSGRLLIVADGAGRHSLTRTLGVRRTVFHKENISVAVFNTRPGDQYGDRAADDVFTSIHVEPDVLFSIATNGSTATCAATHQANERTTRLTAFEFARRNGLTSPLVEPPALVPVTLASLDRFAYGNILMIGDAATAGNPRYGLGAQSGILWAQKVAESINSLDPEPLTEAVGNLEMFGQDLAKRRESIEMVMLDFLARYAIRELDVANLMFSDDWLKSLTDVQFRSSNERRRTHIHALLRYDFLKQGPSDNLLSPFLQEIGTLSIEARLNSKTRGNQMTATLGGDSFVCITLGAYSMRLTQGVVRIQRRKHSWLIDVSKGLSLNVPVTSGGVRSQGTELRFERFRACINHGLIESLLDSMPQNIDMLNHVARSPISLDIDLRDNAPIAWGGLTVCPSGSTRVRYQIRQSRSGHPEISIEILAGRLALESFTNWSRNATLSTLAPIKAFSRMTLGVFDQSLDQLARASGGLMRGMDVEMRPNGGAILTVRTSIPMSFLLSRRETDELRRDMFRSMFSQSLASSQRAIERVEIG